MAALFFSGSGLDHQQVSRASDAQDLALRVQSDGDFQPKRGVRVPSCVCGLLSFPEFHLAETGTRHPIPIGTTGHRLNAGTVRRPVALADRAHEASRGQIVEVQFVGPAAHHGPPLVQKRHRINRTDSLRDASELHGPRLLRGILRPLIDPGSEHLDLRRRKVDSARFVVLGRHDFVL